MKVARLAIALIAPLLVVATGCGERGDPTVPAGSPGGPGTGSGSPPADQGGGQSGNPGLAGRTFLSIDVTENGNPRPLTGETRVRFRFTDDGRLIADAGCNSMQSPVRFNGDRLEVPELSITGMGCDKPRHDQDAWLAEFLQGKPSLSLDGSGLILRSASTELIMVDGDVAEPDLGLQGPRWAVDTLVTGEVASSVAAGTEASLVFGADTVTVAAGCNSGSGRYQVNGDTLRFEAIATTRKACEPDVMRLEDAVLGVLDGEVTYTIDADRLTLKHPSGKQLGLRGNQ